MSFAEREAVCFVGALGAPSSRFFAPHSQHWAGHLPQHHGGAAARDGRHQVPPFGAAGSHGVGGLARQEERQGILRISKLIAWRAISSSSAVLYHFGQVRMSRVPDPLVRTSKRVTVTPPFRPRGRN
jgi:hypothetical protein